MGTGVVFWLWFCQGIQDKLGNNTGDYGVTTNLLCKVYQSNWCYWGREIKKQYVVLAIASIAHGLRRFVCTGLKVFEIKKRVFLKGCMVLREVFPTLHQQKQSHYRSFLLLFPLLAVQ